MVDILGADGAEAAGGPTRTVGGAVTPAGLGMLKPVPMGCAIRGALGVDEETAGTTGLGKLTPPTPRFGLLGETDADGFGMWKESGFILAGPTPGAGIVEIAGAGPLGAGVRGFGILVPPRPGFGTLGGGGGVMPCGGRTPGACPAGKRGGAGTRWMPRG